MFNNQEFIKDLTFLKENFLLFENNRSEIKKTNEVNNEKREKFLLSLKDLLEKFNKVHSDLFIKFYNKKEYYSTYIRYYNNLVLSKIKHFFFREKPSKPYSFLDSKFNSDDFIALLLEIKNEKSIEENLSKYFLFFFFAFDFLYYKDLNREKEGFFTDFAINEKVFKKSKEYILKKIEDIYSYKLPEEREYFFRLWGNQIIAQILKINLYIAQDKNINDLELKLETYEKLNAAYRDYIQYKKNNKDFTIEPFSYFIAYEIWKNAHLLHRKADLNKDFIADYSKYIENLFNEFENVYKNKRLNYKNIYTLQIKLIKEVEKLIDDFDCIRQDIKLNIKGISLIKKESEENNFINLKIKNEPEHFSIEKLLEEENGIYKLNYLIDNLFDKVINNNIGDKISLFSSYTSGAFLSILFGLRFPDKIENIYLFKTFPFVDLQPYYYVKKDFIRSNNIAKECNILPDFKEADNIVFLDDIMRTGFTYSMIKYAYYRVIHEDIENKNLKYFVFFKNSKLENMKFVKGLYTSVTNSENDSSYQLDDIYTNKELFKFNDLNIKIGNEGIEEILKKYLSIEIFNNDKIDYSFILIKPYLVWTIIKEFKNILDEKILSDASNNLYFYSFSPQGKTILLLLIYFFKNYYPDKKIFINKVKDHNDINGNDIFIDITINTGATAEIGLKMRNVIKNKQEMLENVNFLVVKNHSNLDFEKLYSLLS